MTLTIPQFPLVVDFADFFPIGAKEPSSTDSRPSEARPSFFVFDGTLEHRAALRARLKALGETPPEHDADLFWALYARLGNAALSEMFGAYVAVFWDEKRQAITAVRDPWGVRSIYYAYDDRRIAFSTDVATLVGWLGRRDIDLQSLRLYLTLQYIPAPRTMITGIYKLPAGELLTAKPGMVTLERYFMPSFVVEEGKSVDDWARTIRQSLESAIDRRLEELGGERAVGSFLSSGLDSTIVAALLKARIPVRTFSLCFPGERDECPAAEASAKFLGTVHASRKVDRETFMATVDTFVRVQNEPLADPSAVALYLLSEAAAETVDVVFSGEGADELFGGYRVYQEVFALRPAQRLSAVFSPKMRCKLEQWIRALPPFYGQNYLFRAFTDVRRRYVGGAHIFPGHAAALVGYIHPAYRDRFSALDDPVDWMHRQTPPPPLEDAIHYMQWIDLMYWMPNDILAKGQRMTAAHRLALAMPFLDPEVYEVARRIPSALNVDARETKRLLRYAFRDVVPETALKRRKLGFPVPLRAWLRDGQARRLVEDFLASEAGAYFDAGALFRLADEQDSGAADHARKIWLLFILSRWLRSI
ncbi:MAG: hypothetical protein IMW86_04100 [Hydrogenibacillus sp.]|nr:hypothetical protein [Hydrogenibacillus sp.]